MKRLVLIAAAVLVPFGLLVAWGLAALGDEPPPLPPPARVEPAPPAPAVVESPPVARVPPPPAPQPAPPPEPPPEEPPPPGPRDEATVRAAVVDQLNPVVHICFLEMNDRLKQSIKVVTSFDTTETGALTNVSVKMKSADPYVVACVQDALEGATLDQARGLPNGTMRHTFSFNPAGAK